MGGVGIKRRDGVAEQVDRGLETRRQEQEAEGVELDVVEIAGDDVVGPLIEGCANSGFDAVEIDNLDTWTRFDSISQEGAFALAQAYVAAAHDLGLAIAQKNAAEAARPAHDDLGFDFAVVEECGAYTECAAYTDVCGSHVLQIEYPDSLAEAGQSFADVCADPARAPFTILRDRDLVRQDDPAYVYDAC